MLSLRCKRSSFALPEELALAVNNGVSCEDKSPRKKNVQKARDCHSLPDAESLKLDARCVPTESKAYRTCRLILTFFVSNIQLFIILGLSITLLLVLLPDSRGTNLRSSGNIESSVHGYVESQHKIHPDILGDALLQDPLSSQGKALQKTVMAGSAGASSAIS